MTIQEFWSGFANFLNAGCLYLVMLLGRSAISSLPVLLTVLLLRKTVFKRTVFLKGILWCLFLPLPFVGKMRFFYENRMGVRLFAWWHDLCIEHHWIGWLYLLGIAGLGCYIFCRRRRLYRFVSGLRRETTAGRELFICDRPVTPFTTGLFRPRIVMPEVLVKDFRAEELRMILLHETTHIRLGHLWIYALWDMLRVLLWINPLLTICTGYLREDLEAICDRVTIQRSGAKAYDYGRLLLNSLRLLGDERVDTMAAFAGEQEYRSIRNRIKQVAAFQPYRKPTAVISILGCILLVFGLLFGIRQLSYPVYVEREDVSIWDTKFHLQEIGSQDQLRDVLIIDDGYVYIKRDAWRKVLQEQGVETDTCYVSFGGYLKLPGIGGGGNAVYVDLEEAEEILVIPYFNNDRVLWTRLFKLL